MFARLMPQENQFFDLFNAQAELISQGARELGSLVDDLVSGKDALARHVAAIDDIEKRGDKITHEGTGPEGEIIFKTVYHTKDG